MPPNDKPIEQNPQAGGSYIRQGDGSLELQHATKPAPLDVAREPKPAEEAAAPAPVIERDDITGQE